MATKILIIAGPTASGKTARAVEEALARGGEVISVDSRQVYRTLDIGTEKITRDEMRGVPHHLIDVREPEETYSAGDFLSDATRLIAEISARGKLPILAGGTHFYLDALMKGLPPETPPNEKLRAELEPLSETELFARIEASDPERAAMLDSRNRRRLIRALEIIAAHGAVPKRPIPKPLPYDAEWILLEPTDDELKARIDEREALKFPRGLIEEVSAVRQHVAKAAESSSPDAATAASRGDTRLSEFGLEYRVVGEFLRGEREEASILPALRAQLWQYARRQKAWLRKLRDELIRQD